MRQRPKNQTTTYSNSSVESVPTTLDASRRGFIVKSAAAASLLAASPRMVFGESRPTRAAETTIGELFQSLSSDQKATVAKPWTDPLRERVNPNWHITKPTIGDHFYTASQKSLAETIVKQLTSESGHERLMKQTEDDDGGIEAYSMAWFGKPGDEKFEWMLTGRHLTLRADGNTQDKIVFGGPVAYGHGEESSPKDNLFYYQTLKVQSVFESLSTEQRKKALVGKNPPAETKVAIQGTQGRFDGLQGSDLQGEQRTLFQQAIKSILSMYRDDDSTEANTIIEQNGGLDNLRIAYYSKNDLLSDSIWDVWRIEGPSAVIHFRGAPHVHAFIHIASPRAT